VDDLIAEQADRIQLELERVRDGGRRGNAVLTDFGPR